MQKTKLAVRGKPSERKIDWIDINLTQGEDADWLKSESGLAADAVDHMLDEHNSID